MRRLLFAISTLSALACGPVIGDPCTTGTDCGSGVCVNRDFSPGGYCSRTCDLTAPDCPAGTICIRDALGRGQPGCMRTCITAPECRQGYVCRPEKDSQQAVCVGPTGV